MTVCEGATGETEQIRKDEGLPQLRPTLVDTVKRRMCIHEQFSLKNRPRFCTTSPTAQDTFRPIPDLISCSGVTGRWGLLSLAQSESGG